MLLGRANVAGVLKGDPRVTCFEQHGQHLAPQFGSLDALEQLQFAGTGLLFISLVALLKGAPVQIVQVFGVCW